MTNALKKGKNQIKIRFLVEKKCRNCSKNFVKLAKSIETRENALERSIKSTIKGEKCATHMHFRIAHVQNVCIWHIFHSISQPMIHQSLLAPVSLATKKVKSELETKK